MRIVMSTLDFILNKFNIDPSQRSPIQLPISRHGLAKLFCELGFKHGAEIGVETGLYSRALCHYNPDLTLYCVDAWRVFRSYRDHTSQSKLDKFYEKAKERLKPYNARIIRQFSLDAVKEFKDRTLDFVYIDAAHDFQNATNDICEWGKKVKPNGIIAGHDYENHKGKSLIHVKQVVDGYTQAYEIRPWFTTNTDEDEQGVGLKTARSWLWVKP